jgi:hypothetical protein
VEQHKPVVLGDVQVVVASCDAAKRCENAPGFRAKPCRELRRVAGLAVRREGSLDSAALPATMKNCFNDCNLKLFMSNLLECGACAAVDFAGRCECPYTFLLRETSRNRTCRSEESPR